MYRRRLMCESVTVLNELLVSRGTVLSNIDIDFSKSVTIKYDIITTVPKEIASLWIFYEINGVARPASGGYQYGVAFYYTNLSGQSVVCNEPHTVHKTFPQGVRFYSEFSISGTTASIVIPAYGDTPRTKNDVYVNYGGNITLLFACLLRSMIIEENGIVTHEIVGASVGSRNCLYDKVTKRVVVYIP